MRPERAEAPRSGGRFAQSATHRSNHGQGRALSLVPVVPCDLEAELSVLAELADPLHDHSELRGLTSAMFYDGRNASIVEALQTGESLRPADAKYIDHAIRYAFPLTAGLLAAFLDTAAKRSRLDELERERCELLGVAM